MTLTLFHAGSGQIAPQGAFRHPAGIAGRLRRRRTPPRQGRPAADPGRQEPSGFVEMREVQVAYIGNAGGGSGTLTYQGRSYPFRIAGLGVGGWASRRSTPRARSTT